MDIRTIFLIRKEFGFTMQDVKFGGRCEIMVVYTINLKAYMIK